MFYSSMEEKSTKMGNQMLTDLQMPPIIQKGRADGSEPCSHSQMTHFICDAVPVAAHPTLTHQTEHDTGEAAT